VFWVMDNGSSHRGESSVQRLTQAHPRLVPMHGPVHASWLNQTEIYFSIVQRKVLTPNDFPCLEAVAERLSGFERYYESIAQPFEWKFTRADLNALLATMRTGDSESQLQKMVAGPARRGPERTRLTSRRSRSGSTMLGPPGA
jgi:hypothetical protein